ncbi:MAG TPA: hypothetical protein VMT05_06410 [Terriglobales bacterium]|jgi:hypothetical protein|nr:hypothetical protein [Terriglobales bacterium]
MRYAAVLFVLVILSASATALDRGCSQGVGEWTENLWDGYKIEIAAAPSGAATQCLAALRSADGKVLFEVTGAEALVNPISGHDINGDGKPDVVIETHRTAGQCCYTYSILTPGADPPLVRQMTTTPPLAFEDRDNNGKIEISTYDFAFVGIEGLGESDSPRPLVVFRLRGNTLYNVSASYWPEYQREIEVAKNGLSRGAEELLLGRNNTSGATVGAGGGGGKPRELSPAEEKDLAVAKSVVLTMALNYLYGGRGEEAWKTIREMWTDRDKDRIRQAILLSRSRGVLSEVNRPTATKSPSQ